MSSPSSISSIVMTPDARHSSPENQEETSEARLMKRYDELAQPVKNAILAGILNFAEPLAWAAEDPEEYIEYESPDQIHLLGQQLPASTEDWQPRKLDKPVRFKETPAYGPAEVFLDFLSRRDNPPAKEFLNRIVLHAPSLRVTHFEAGEHLLGVADWCRKNPDVKVDYVFCSACENSEDNFTARMLHVSHITRGNDLAESLLKLKQKKGEKPWLDEIGVDAINVHNLQFFPTELLADGDGTERQLPGFVWTMQGKNDVLEHVFRVCELGI